MPEPLFGHDAYVAFVGQHAKARALVTHARGLPAGPISDACRQSACVLMVAEFESLVRALLQQRLDSLNADWNHKTDGDRRVVATAMHVRLRYVLDSLPAIESAHHAQRLRDEIADIALWADDPSSFAKAGAFNVGDVYRAETAPKGLEKLLGQFRDDGALFFKFLEARGLDRSSYWVTTEQLVRIRNDVAHGLHQVPQPTDVEVRGYLARVGVLGRQVVAYLRGYTT